MAGQLKKSGAQKSLDFESAMVELEQIVADMEAGKLPLEDSLTAYKRGAELLSFCRGRLEDAQQQVSVLENGVLKDFSANGETGQAASTKPLVPSGAEGSGRD
ncbi:MAG: exodeoxyribonuclease VII small subunit [Gallionella sp.]|nr:exodeoxyribonuclease VII small subunit [Gallionella sp.]